MSGAIPPLPSTPSWVDAQLKHRDIFTFTLWNTLKVTNTLDVEEICKHFLICDLEMRVFLGRVDVDCFHRKLLVCFGDHTESTMFHLQ
jgi:hypothetical protein